VDALTIETLKEYSSEFLAALSQLPIPTLYGATDGKAVGTFVEAKFHEHLNKRFTHEAGNAALGVDFPSLGVDLKVTSVRQPQSSCPFRSASQKVFGLGYHLLVFVYDKTDDHEHKTATLHFEHALFIDSSRTADYQTTKGLLDILDRGGNQEDVAAFIEERNLPVDDIGRVQLAERILSQRPQLGVITMSNALQWRLQYGRAITVAGQQSGVDKLL
jgi:hypothetical protein